MDDAKQTDIIVVGSGAAGFAAALSAARFGASVLVLESAPVVGGTSAMSGALVWAPCNHHMLEEGLEDTPEDALAYMRAALPSRQNDPRLTRFIETMPSVVRFIEDNTPLRFQTLPYPDTFSELPGGRPAGRHLEPLPIRRANRGKSKPSLRKPSAPHIFSVGEAQQHGLAINPMRAPKLTALSRLLGGKATMGSGLISGLLAGCADAGVEIITNAEAKSLLPADNGRIIGIEALIEGEPQRLFADKGVILASGGFEWNAALREKYFRAPLSHFPSADSNRGGGLIMAEKAGAALANMDEAWWWPTSSPPGEDNADDGRLIFGEKTYPHSIFVNKSGRRFVNETSHNVGEALIETTATGEPANQPAWAIFDAQYRAKYTVLLKLLPGGKDPDWLIKADDLTELAAKIGVDPAELEKTVETFNRDVKNGKDSQFGRGETLYDRYAGDRDAPHPNLGPLNKAPYYAVPVFASCVGAKGGVMTSVNAEALDAEGRPIAGLWAAGNVMAAFIGPQTIAGGATIASALCWGFLAGRHAAGAPFEP